MASRAGAFRARAWAFGARGRGPAAASVARGRRRSRRAVGGEDDGEADDTNARIDAAAAVLDTIIRETVEAIFIEEAATEVFNEASDADAREPMEVD